MGVLEYVGLRSKALRASPQVVESLSESGAAYNLIAVEPRAYGSNRAVSAAFVEAQSASYAYMYCRQPSVRRVVDYIARNVAQLPLKLYERTSDTERHEAGDHPAAYAMRHPNYYCPGQQFVFNIVADWLVFDQAFILKLRPKPNAPLVLLQLPPYAVQVIGSNRYSADGYRVTRADGTYFDQPPENVFHWHGYNPSDPRVGISKLETLRSELASDRAIQTASDELNKSGLGTSGIIERPLDAPEWSDLARQRFEEDWANRSKQATKRTPVLEEGMQFKPAFVSPKDAESLRSREFALERVADLYGIGSIPPKDDAERYQFYADVLPPVCEMFCDHLNQSILVGEYDDEDYYFEFNLDEKLNGPERLNALVSATGGPVMTRREARTILNLPPLPKDGDDELITPMNVIVGGKPSPQVMPIQDPNGPDQGGGQRNGGPGPLAAGARSRSSSNGHGKADEPAYEEKAVQHYIGRRVGQLRRRDKWAKRYADVLDKHFAHQQRSKRTEVNGEGQNKALAAALFAVMYDQVGEEGQIAAHRLGLSEFDHDRTRSYIDKVATEEAQRINLETRMQLLEGDRAEVFKEARNLRVKGASEKFATQFTNWPHVEAARSTPDAWRRLKRWVVEDPDVSAHPEMDGERVPIEGVFSNGKQYPPYEHPGCKCMVEIE